MDGAQTNGRSVRGPRAHSRWDKGGGRGGGRGKGLVWGATSPAGVGAPGTQGGGSLSQCRGASGEGRKLGSSQGPRATPPGWGGGGAGWFGYRRSSGPPPQARAISVCRGWGPGAGVIRAPARSPRCPLLLQGQRLGAGPVQVIRGDLPSRSSSTSAKITKVTLGFQVDITAAWGHRSTRYNDKSKSQSAPCTMIPCL